MLDRNRRGLDPQKPRGALGMVAGRRDDMFGMDFERLFARHQHAALFHHDMARDDPFRPGPFIAVDLGFLDDLHPPLACALGHRLGHVGRVDIAVLRVIERADQVLGPDQRPAVLDLFRRQKLVIDVRRLGHGRIEHIFVHPLLPLGHAQVAHHIEARVQAGLGLQRLVEIDRIFVDMGRGIGHVEQGQKPRRMPGRPRGQRVTLQQHRIPARLGQVIGDTCPDGAAADDKGFDMGFHLGAPGRFIWAISDRLADFRKGQPDAMRPKATWSHVADCARNGAGGWLGSCRIPSPARRAPNDRSGHSLDRTNPAPTSTTDRIRVRLIGWAARPKVPVQSRISAADN